MWQTEDDEGGDGGLTAKGTTVACSFTQAPAEGIEAPKPHANNQCSRNWKALPGGWPALSSTARAKNNWGRAWPTETGTCRSRLKSAALAPGTRLVLQGRGTLPPSPDPVPAFYSGGAQERRAGPETCPSPAAPGDCPPLLPGCILRNPPSRD